MPQNKTVKLGLMPPLTGLVGIYGTEISRAGQIACDEVNKNGGVLGKPLELIIEDDGSLPDSAVVAARKLVDTHHCSAIIGNLLSNSRIAVAYQVAEPRKIPLLNFSFYEGSIQSRYFFHFAALPNQQIDRMIPYMREKFGPRMFFAGNNYEWPRGSIDAAKRALLRAGGVVVGEEYCPIGTPQEEIERLLDHVEKAAPDVFVPYFAGSDQVNLLTRFTQRGLKKKIAVVMGHYDEMMASILPSEVREGFYSSNTYFMTVDSAENKQYLARLAKLPDVTGIWPKGNGILTNFGEGTYLCVKAFAQATNSAGSLDPEALIDALKSISVTGPQGTVTMDTATHHATVNTYLSRCSAEGIFNIVERFGPIKPLIPGRYNHQRIDNQATMEEDIRLQARMLEQMTEAVLLTNAANGSIVYANAGAERLFGYDNGELPGTPISALNVPLLHQPDDRASFSLDELAHKGRWDGEIRNIKKDGTQIWTSASISTFTHPAYGEVWLAVHRDITERKQMEQVLLRQEALKESEKRSRAIIDASPIPLAINNEQGDITFLNNAFVKTLGYTPKDIPTLEAWWPLAYPDPQYRQWVAEKWQKNIEESNLREVAFTPMEVNIVCRDKSVRTFLVSAAPLEEGINGDYLISLYDITERKINEQTLIKNTERLNEAQHIAQIGHWILNLPGGELIWSDEIFRIFEIDQARFGATYEAFLNAIHPDDRDAVNQAYSNSLSSREPYEITHRLLMSDGRIKWVLEKCHSTFDATGAPVQSRGMVQDITKIKLAEIALLATHKETELAVAKFSESTRRLNTAQRIARLGDYALDLQNGEMIWSDTMFELLGFAPHSVTPSNELFMSLIHPDDLPSVAKKMQEALQKSYPPNADQRVVLPSIKYRIIHPDGSIHWMLSDAVAEINDNGLPIRVACPVQDISQRVKDEQLITNARDEAERANAAKSEFLSRMSHELRTPMNAILGFGQLLELDQTQKLSAQQSDNVREIIHAGTHLLELINEILDLSRIESGRLEIKLEPINMPPMIKACVAQLQPLAEKRHLRFSLALNPACTVQADALRLREILSNLISNAIKYNSEGGEIHVSCEPAGERQVRVSVRDSGRGIAADALPRLFKTFERMESAYDGIEGSGIGLALAKKLVEAMHGEIGVESVQGSGSTFWFDLPLASAPELLKSPAIPAALPVSKGGTQRKILYIEDNPANLRLVKKIIAMRKDIELLEAVNAETGLEIAFKQRPDLILLDIQLPGMDGFAALKHLRDNPATRDIPVIAVSANAMITDVERGKAVGFADYLTKPIEVRQLLDAVAQIFDAK